LVPLPLLRIAANAAEVDSKLGLSLGGDLALAVASLDPRVRAVVEFLIGKGVRRFGAASH
jgi:hypothetical protein